MNIIPNYLRNSTCEKAVSSLKSVRASNYHELRARYPKVFGIKIDRGGVSGLVVEPDDYAICPQTEIGKDEVEG